MKKIIFIINLILLTVFISCNDNQILDNKIINSENPHYIGTNNPYDSIGTYHNEIVDFYKSVYQTNVINRFFYYDNISYITIEAYNNMLNCIKDYSDYALGWDSIVVENTIDSLNALYDNLGLFVTIGGTEYLQILKDFHGAINYCNSQGAYDPETFAAFITIYDNSELGFVCNIDDIVDSLESSQIPDWSNEIIGYYLSTYRHSEEFWEDPIATIKDTTQPYPCGLNPDQALAAADGGGALVGALWSGIGAIVVGAIATMAEAEDQENNNSILVGHEYPESRYYKRK
jgi:hypothetical protein